MSTMSLASSVMLTLVLLHGAASSHPAASAASSSLCADNESVQSDDGVESMFLQTQAVISNSEKRNDVIQSFHGMMQKNTRLSSFAWPQPDDPDLRVTNLDLMQAQECKYAFNMKDPETYNTSHPCCLALKPPDFNIEHGIHDILFQILKSYQDDKFQWVRQWAWRGLSDNCFTEVGGESIANIGGPNKGVEYMVQQLLVNPPYAGMCTDHIDIQYEILADLQGLLYFDNNNTRGPAAMKAGLVPAIVRSFNIEPDFRPTLNFACRVMTHLMMRNPEYVHSFRDAGVPELVNRSIEVLQEPDDTEFHFEVTVSEYFQPESCRYPQLMMMGDADSKQEADALLQAYIANTKEWKPWATIKV